MRKAAGEIPMFLLEKLKAAGPGQKRLLLTNTINECVQKNEESGEWQIVLDNPKFRELFSHSQCNIALLIQS